MRFTITFNTFLQMLTVEDQEATLKAVHEHKEKIWRQIGGIRKEGSKINSLIRGKDKLKAV